MVLAEKYHYLLFPSYDLPFVCAFYWFVFYFSPGAGVKKRAAARLHGIIVKRRARAFSALPGTRYEHSGMGFVVGLPAFAHPASAVTRGTLAATLGACSSRRYAHLSSSSPAGEQYRN
jgi:hypothetical protein